MTIFTFTNPKTAPSIDINEHTITGFLGTSPERVNQPSVKNDVGMTLNFKFMGGSLFVNGTQVVRSDITFKNGVLYQLEHVSCYCLS